MNPSTKKKLGLVTAVWLAVLQLSSIPAEESSMTVVSLDLQSRIDETLANGESELVLAPGLYSVPTTITVQKVKKFTLNGSGATLRMPADGELLAFFGVEEVTVKNLIVDCDPLPFTQGTITKISDDYSVFDYEVHPGYPTLDNFTEPSIGSSGIFVFDPETLHWRQDVPDLYTKQSEMITPTTGRFSFNHILPGYHNIKVGDYVATKNPRGNTFLFKGCGSIVLEDVTVHTGPGAGFLIRTSSGGTRLTRCKIERGPKPVGATHERLLSTVADGLNLGYCRKGVIMEDCEFSNMGDDSVNLHGTLMDLAVVEDETTFLIARPWSDEPVHQVLPGDQVRILDGKSYGLVDEATIVEVKTIPHPPSFDEAVFNRYKMKDRSKLYCIRIKLDRAVKMDVGNSIEVPAIACPNFVFRNNYFHDHRARGLRLGASHGVIEGNRFERIKSTPISLGPHCIHHEGGWVRDVVVRNNIIIDSCFDDRAFEKGSYNAAAIVVQHFLQDNSAPYVQENQDIHIIQNRIENVGGAGILATSAKSLEVVGNIISGTHQRNCDEVGASIRLISTGAISLNHSHGVIIKDNDISDPGPFCRGDVVINNSSDVHDDTRD